MSNPNIAGSAHTPGPWAFDPEDGSVYFDDGDVAPLIATVNMDEVSAEQANADGDLIAAAPDMLAALTGMLDIAECWAALDHGKNIDLDASDAVRTARAAIAKATGAA